MNISFNIQWKRIKTNYKISSVIRCSYRDLLDIRSTLSLVHAANQKIAQKMACVKHKFILQMLVLTRFYTDV